MKPEKKLDELVEQWLRTLPTIKIIIDLVNKDYEQNSKPIMEKVIIEKLCKN